ncbi:SDR family NAD(P)-dependent oxidoreductase [Flavobacterium sp. Sd200]|uniref:oxidoreductase n=1 Tax=Flavobacterium sp. Sd200 TaxID=2692211 RepID=UPI001369FD29|nr:oxidoreductase [Flavobacterium sp. Sd200]MXN92006.1 SDR family NAD(P)-dependent oxidoreductase [Flavobacterium sp. Sd200]
MWTKENIPDQTGKTVIVTGANAGIGYETALALYEKNANIILACRDLDKANAAAKTIATVPSEGSVEVLALDLSDLNSVKTAADTFKSKHQKLDLLINNAGVMVPPASKTVQGFELQFGTNVLGHYAFTGYLYPLLKATPQSRVVTVSSLVYRLGSIDYDNLKTEKDYDANREYAQSKLANLFFTSELQRRANEAGDQILSVSSHPGVTQTELARYISKEEFDNIIEVYGELMPAWQGALPSLYAAVSDDVKGNDFIGPDKDGGLRGYPAKTELLPLAHNQTEAAKLWKYAEEVTGVVYF